MEIEVITAAQMDELDKLLMTNPDMKKKVKKILSNVLNKARATTSDAVRGIIDNDPRAAYKAVKRTVYKKLIGGSISILSKRKTSSTRVRVERDGIIARDPHHRGGNRTKRSLRTEKVDSYYGSDRGFILRFLNAGTSTRTTRYGNRGSIAARDWFWKTSQRDMEYYAEVFCQLVDQEIKNVLKS